MAHEIVPSTLIVKAMQDSGYKNAAYALAELIDNSIQAGAEVVELMCLESEVFIAQRHMKRLTRLAVIDNGCGMNTDELRRALQFGNGGHLNDREGIGRFGDDLRIRVVWCRELNEVSACWKLRKVYQFDVHAGRPRKTGLSKYLSAENID